MRKRSTDRTLEKLLPLVGQRVQVVVQHSVRGRKSDPREVTGRLLAVAQKLGRDQEHAVQFVSPVGAVVQQHNGETWFISLRTIALVEPVPADQPI